MLTVPFPAPFKLKKEWWVRLTTVVLSVDTNIQYLIKKELDFANRKIKQLDDVSKKLRHENE